MDATVYLRYQFAALHERAGIPLAAITDEQVNCSPPGTANKIGAVLLHAVSGEDLFIQQYLQGKPLVWDTQGWGEKIGIPYPPGGDKGWNEARQAALHLTTILEYQQAVFASTTAYLDGLTPEDLDRIVPFFGYEFPVAQLLAMAVCHTAEHIGEISTLKGVMGIGAALAR